MKKNFKIIVAIALVVMFALMLVACGNVTNEVDGNYYSIDTDKGIIEILSVNGGEFTITSFKINDIAKIPDDYSKIETTFASEIQQNGTVVKGTCTYINNAFINSRLELKYTEGKSGSTYAYLKEAEVKVVDEETKETKIVNNLSYNYSPKMGSILIYALLGFCITLAVLCVLMAVIKILGFSVDKISAKVKEKSKSNEESETSEPTEPKLAKGSTGELILENVSDRDAAMIMAIVADELQEPLNSLRFISIKDITEQEAKNNEVTK